MCWGIACDICGEPCGCAAHLSGAPRVRGVPLLPRPRRGFTDREDRAEGLALYGLGEDLVDEVDALRCGQEWTVLGVLVEVPHEGVEAGVGDADALGGDAPRPGENCRGVFLPKMRKDEPRSPPHLCTGGLLPKGAERLGVHDPTLPGV